MTEMKAIAGFEDYAVDADGNVWRIRATATGRRWKNRPVPYMLKATNAARTGYPLVVLCRNGQHVAKYVHWLVCEAFHGPRNGRDVAHNDGSRTNNAATNLRWASSKENCADCVKHGTRLLGEKVTGAKLTGDIVRRIRKIAYFRGLYTQLSHELGVSNTVVKDAYLGISWAHI